MPYKKSEETRRLILEAAVQLFREKGYEATDMKEIADRVGVAHTALYYYFHNKEDIADVIYDRETERVVAVMHEVDRREGDTLVKLILQYILQLDRLAQDRATESVFFDMIHYDTYDEENLARVRREFYILPEQLAGERGVDCTDEFMLSFILTGDAYVKALLKGVRMGHFSLTGEQVMDRFFSHLIFADFRVTPEEYREKKAAAYALFETLDLA